MSKRLSELYGMDIYTEKAMYVGKVEDVILNLEKGEIMRLSTKSFKGGGLPSDEVRKILQSESVAYTEVRQVGDVVLVDKAPVPLKKADQPRL